MALAIGVAGLVVFGKLLPTNQIDWRALLIFAGALGLVLLNRVPVIVIVAAAALAGVMLY
jgi:hypothetical protein